MGGMIQSYVRSIIKRGHKNRPLSFSFSLINIQKKKNDPNRIAFSFTQE
jgi:hypothetical protein